MVSPTSRIHVKTKFALLRATILSFLLFALQDTYISLVSANIQLYAESTSYFIITRRILSRGLKNIFTVRLHQNIFNAEAATGRTYSLHFSPVQVKTSPGKSTWNDAASEQKNFRKENAMPIIIMIKKT